MPVRLFLSSSVQQPQRQESCEADEAVEYESQYRGKAPLERRLRSEEYVRSKDGAKVWHKWF